MPTEASNTGFSQETPNAGVSQSQNTEFGIRIPSFQTQHRTVNGLPSNSSIIPGISQFWQVAENFRDGTRFHQVQDTLYTPITHFELQRRYEALIDAQGRYIYGPIEGSSQPVYVPNLPAHTINQEKCCITVKYPTLHKWTDVWTTNNEDSHTSPKLQPNEADGSNDVPTDSPINPSPSKPELLGQHFLMQGVVGLVIYFSTLTYC